jgi:hypothetical protein
MSSSFTAVVCPWQNYKKRFFSSEHKKSKETNRWGVWTYLLQHNRNDPSVTRSTEWPYLINSARICKHWAQQICRSRCNIVFPSRKLSRLTWPIDWDQRVSPLSWYYDNISYPMTTLNMPANCTEYSAQGLTYCKCIGHKESRAASLSRRTEEMKEWRCECTYERDV